MKRARSYAEERSSTTDLTEPVDYRVNRCKKFPNIIKVPTQSAHINRRTYHPIIKFNKEEVLDWWCDCASGSRYVGCCSHIASAIWFLSYQRWQTRYRSVSSTEFINLFKDAAARPETSDFSSGSEDDSDADDHVNA